MPSEWDFVINNCWTPKRWGERFDEPHIDDGEKRELLALAEAIWPKNPSAHFSYWLICYGYYELVDVGGNCPKYQGRLDAIPASHFGYVNRELMKCRDH